MPNDPALDDVGAAARTITDLLTHQTLIAVDFSDVRTVLHRGGQGGGGRATFGTGEASGPDGAVKAAEAALLDLKRRRDCP